MIDERSIVSWLNSPTHVKGFMTTRVGGVSKGECSGLNLGINTFDVPTLIAENYRLLKEFVQINHLAVMNQVHGSKVLQINNLPKKTPVCDGLFTLEKGLALGVQTADCFPVLLSGERGVAALHCGWRSLNGGIIENCIELFKKHDDFPTSAFVGAGICEACYFVRDDMVAALRKSYEPEKFLTKNGDGYSLNLKGLVQNVLNLIGVKNVEVSPLSSCHSEGFYSYRRDNALTGRMLCVIVREL